MSNDSHEGEKIKRLLDESGVTIQELARKADVSWTAAKKWIQAEVLGPLARQSASTALVKVGIDPRLIWPTSSVRVTNAADELKPLLMGFTDDQLRSVVKLLEADRGDQLTIINFIEGMLFRRP